jgi:hypothetical protein
MQTNMNLAALLAVANDLQYDLQGFAWDPRSSVGFPAGKTASSRAARLLARFSLVAARRQIDDE